VRNVLLLFVFSITCAVTTWALENPGSELDSVFVKDSIGTQVPLDLKFQDSSGQVVQLAELFKTNRPVVIIPAYYDCPRLCGLVMGGVSKLVKALPLKLGEDYQMVTVSFDDSEGPEQATKRAKQYHAEVGLQDGSPAWRFLVGEAGNISTLMKAIGFKYLRDKGEFAHSAAVYVLTPDGVVSQFFAGIDFKPEDFRLALVEASQGVLGTALDHILLYCYRFDPTKGKYTLAVLNLVRVVSIATFLILAFLVIRLRLQERGRDTDK
jgi:protein SCO1/2